MRTLFFVLAMAGVAGGQTFTHRAHLLLKLECTQCHVAANNLLPSRDDCLKCHKAAVIGPLPAKRLAHFDHAVHLKMGNLAPVIAAVIDKGAYLAPPDATLREFLNSSNACVACHRSLVAFVKPDPMRQMADCLVCHSKIDPPDSCEFCHGKGVNLKPASHTPDYLDTHTNAKFDATTCAVCHGRHFRCLGCH